MRLPFTDTESAGSLCSAKRREDNSRTTDNKDAVKHVSKDNSPLLTT